MTLGQVRRLPMDEFVAWGVYYARKAQAAELRALQRKG